MLSFSEVRLYKEACSEHGRVRLDSAVECTFFILIYELLFNIIICLLIVFQFVRAAETK